mgnify:CR=1 FL=1
MALAPGRVNLLVAPCVSPWAYERIQRWNFDALDPNRSFRADSPARQVDPQFDAIETLLKGKEVPLPEGTYLWALGPQFETPAEIRMFAAWGADAVGMSTVPETILARHAGLRVLALSMITNMAAGMSDEKISHEHTKAMAPLGAVKLEKLLRRMLRDLGTLPI